MEPGPHLGLGVEPRALLGAGLRDSVELRPHLGLGVPSSERDCGAGKELRASMRGLWSPGAPQRGAAGLGCSPEHLGEGLGAVPALRHTGQRARGVSVTAPWLCGSQPSPAVSVMILHELPLSDGVRRVMGLLLAHSSAKMPLRSGGVKN